MPHAPMKYCRFIIHAGLLESQMCNNKENEIEIEKLFGEKKECCHKMGYKCDVDYCYRQGDHAFAGFGLVSLKKIVSAVSCRAFIQGHVHKSITRGGNLNT